MFALSDTSAAGPLVAIGILIFSAVWLFFPFLVLGKLSRMLKQLEKIEGNTAREQQRWQGLGKPVERLSATDLSAL